MVLRVNWNILEIQNMKNCSKVLLLMGGKEYPVKMCRCQQIIEILTWYLYILEKFYGQSQSIFTIYEKTEQDWNIWKICYEIFNFFHISFHFLMTTSENPEEPQFRPSITILKYKNGIILFIDSSLLKSTNTKNEKWKVLKADIIPT